jgi:hypothetical protein
MHKLGCALLLGLTSLKEDTADGQGWGNWIFMFRTSPKHFLHNEGNYFSFYFASHFSFHVVIYGWNSKEKLHGDQDYVTKAEL